MSRSSSTAAAIRRRNARVESYRAIVDPIAAHYSRCCRESREDLRQVGLLGLIRAADRYNASSGVPFDAFARPHVRGAILHYLRDGASLLRVPRRLQEQRQALQRSRHLLTQQLGRPPLAEELRHALQLSLGQWQRLEVYQPRPQTLALHRLSDEQEPAWQTTSDAESPALLGDALKLLETLEPRQQQVLRYVVLKGYSLRTTAQRLGSSAATVHRQLHRGLAELRSRLNRPSVAPAC